jgi:large subunit ribosomal protein L32e
MTKQTTETTKKALRLRKRLKHNKPKFVRPESWRYVRLKENWRRPRGLDHKVRLSYAGWPPSARVGYRGPKAARGLHPSGRKDVLVYNVDDLKEIDPAIHAIRIAHAVGKRKRVQIITEARKKKIAILNLKVAREPIPEETELEEEKPAEKEEEKETETAEKPKQKEAKTKKRKKEAKENDRS